MNTLSRKGLRAMSLAITMSKKHEKTQRREIMVEQGCSKVEAAYEIARKNFQKELRYHPNNSG